MTAASAAACAWVPRALRLGLEPGRRGLGLRETGLLDDLGLGVPHLHGGQSGRGRLGLHPFRQPQLGLRVEVGGLQPRLGERELLGRQVRGGRLRRLGRLDVLDQLLLRLRLGRDDDRPAGPLGVLDGAQGEDRLLLLRDRAVHRDPLPDDVGDLAALGLDLLRGGDPVQFGLALAPDDLQHPVLLDALALDGDDALTVLLRDRDLPRLVLALDAELFLGPDERGLRAEPLLLLHPGGGRLLAGAQALDLAALLDLRLGLPALQLQDRLAGVDVLPGDLLLLRALELVGAHVLDRGQLGDLPDALGVQDVGAVELRHRGLLEEVDRGVVEVVAVQVGADDLDDPVPELLALGVEVDEVELLADGLERLGELRGEELLDGDLVAGPLRADGLRDLDDVLDGLVDPDEEGDLDVGADVVLADQALAPGAVDLDLLHRDVHGLGLVEHGQDDGPGEGHVDLLGLGDDQRLALLDLAEQPGDDEDDGDDDEQDSGDEHAYAQGDGIHRESLAAGRYRSS